MDQEQVKALVAQVDKSVVSLAQVRLVRRALKGSRFVPGMRTKLTPEVKAVIEEFLAKKEKELSK